MISTDLMSTIFDEPIIVSSEMTGVYVNYSTELDSHCQINIHELKHMVRDYLSNHMKLDYTVAEIYDVSTILSYWDTDEEWIFTGPNSLFDAGDWAINRFKEKNEIQEV